MKRSSSEISGSDYSLSCICMKARAQARQSLTRTDWRVDDGEDIKPFQSPTPASRFPKTPSLKKPKTTPASSSSGGKSGSWSPELKEKAVERIFTAGLKVVNMTELAKEVSSDKICGRCLWEADGANADKKEARSQQDAALEPTSGGPQGKSERQGHQRGQKRLDEKLGLCTLRHPRWYIYRADRYLEA